MSAPYVAVTVFTDSRGHAWRSQGSPIVQVGSPYTPWQAHTPNKGQRISRSPTVPLFTSVE